MGQMAKKPPQSFRRLTKAEASRLGVSYSAKRQVSAGIKRGNVTKATRLYTNREAATIDLKRHNGFATREKYAAGRVEVRILKKGGKATEYKGLSKAELMKRLKKSGNKPVLLKFGGGKKKGGRKFEVGGGGSPSGATYKGDDVGDDDWYSAFERIDADELLDKDNFNNFLEDSKIDGEPSQYGLVVYE